MKKDKYPKQMTIRYDEQQEKEIKTLMAGTNSNTMSKAFLKTPELIKTQQERINRLNDQNIKLLREQELSNNIRHNWKQFKESIEENVISE